MRSRTFSTASCTCVWSLWRKLTPYISPLGIVLNFEIWANALSSKVEITWLPVDSHEISFLVGTWITAIPCGLKQWLAMHHGICVKHSFKCSCKLASGNAKITWPCPTMILPIRIPAINAKANHSEYHILQNWIQRHHNISSNTWSTTISISNKQSTATQRVCDHSAIQIHAYVQFCSINHWSTISNAVPVTFLFAFYRRLTQFRPKTSAVLLHPASQWARPKWNKKGGGQKQSCVTRNLMMKRNQIKLHDTVEEIRLTSWGW